VALALSGDQRIAAAAVSWLRIALFGAPLILITMAGNGWLRGVQDNVRPLRYVLAGNGLSAVLCPVLVYGAGLGLEGSAIANVAAQAVAGGLFVRALVAERVELRPVPSRMRAQLGLGRDLVLRSLAFQACFISAASVAARTGVPAAGAHQIVLQLWTFLSLVHDSLAIAAQSLVGAALGAGRDRGARALGWQITRYGLTLGLGLGALFAALYAVLPPVFTSDASVLAQVPHAWWFFVALQPIAGIVFALDGVLLGAGDAAFLRTATVGSALLGFLPLVWVSLQTGWGLTGIWIALSAFMVLRVITLLLRMRSDRWAVVGAIR
jgi:putative MATE family efflux protein